MFYFAALVAASAAFTGCSSDDDLSAARAAVSKGYPMYVSASAGDETRGTDLTSGTFNAFTMYSNMTGSASWSTGVNFTKTTSGWSAGTADVSFPDTTTTYTFYGVSDAANIVKENNNPVIGSVTPESFNFTYQIPTVYTAQQDLLVGKTTGSGSDGKVNFTGANKFTHALAKIEAIKVYCSSDNMTTMGYPVGDVTNCFFRVNGIRIGGLKSKGVYTFGNETPWSSQSEEAVFTIDLTESELTFDNMKFVPGTKSNAITLPIGDNGLYLIPQIASGSTTSSGSTYEVVGTYVELDIQFGHWSDPEDHEQGFVFEFAENGSPIDWTEGDSDNAGYAKVRVPISFTIEKGKGYTLYVDVSKAVCAEDAGYRGEGDPLLGDQITIVVG